MAIDWIKSNIPTIIAIGGVFWYTASDNATMKAQLAESERYRAARSQQTDANFANINASLQRMSDLPFRMGAQEGKTQAVNDRVDRLADTILASQEAIRKDISALSTKVEVVDSKVTTLADRPKPGSPELSRPRG